MKTLSGFLKNAGMISLLLITHLAHTQHWEWAKAAHAVASITNDVATDATENIYMIHYPCFSFDPDPILDYEYRFWSERVGIRGATYHKVSDSDNRDEILWREDYLEIKLHDELPAGTYYFQLRAMPEDGSATPWTAALAFEVEGSIRSALIYPNPVKDKLTIAYQATEQETLSLTLYDRNGRVLLQQHAKVRAGRNVLELGIPVVN